jgi:hypothetical protein
MNDPHCLVSRSHRVRSSSNAADAPVGTNLYVPHKSQLLTTPFDARTTRPPRTRTPTARPSSTKISSTCARRVIVPPCLVTPRAKASAMAPLPPT